MEGAIKYIINVVLTLVFILIALSSVMSQTAHDLLKAGDANYKAEDYPQAEIYYRKADNNTPKFSSKFNLGNSIYQQGRFEESVEFYDASTSSADNTSSLSDAHFNKGNALFEQQQYYKAAEAYKEAIRTNPQNKNAQYNLAITKEVIKQMQKQQQEQQEQQENDQQNDSENQEQQENEEQQSGESDQQNQEQEKSCSRNLCNTIRSRG